MKWKNFVVVAFAFLVNSPSSECGNQRENTLTMLDSSIGMATRAREGSESGLRPKVQPEEPPMDCSDVLSRGGRQSGVYTVWPRNKPLFNASLDVFCDMDTDGGGWTVVQRSGNFNPKQNFELSWNEYKVGFGDITKDFWIGNDNLFALSNQAFYRVRFDMRDYRGQESSAVYHEFRIDDENSDYRLHIGSFQKDDQYDCMEFHNNMTFSTMDRETTCSKKLGHGWWYKAVKSQYDICVSCNLNGLYRPGYKSEKIVSWGNGIGLAAIEMKLRRV